jgi:curved DNA-binding protein
MTPPPTEDYYEYLQVSPNADADTIERIYRLLAKKYHPDNTATGSSEKFDILTRAYKVLADPEQRAAYDVRYEQAKQREWRTMTEAAPTEGHGRDDRVRKTILSILYIQRRDNPAEPGVGSWQMEKLIGLPEKMVEFHVWYLKEKQWIARTDTGGYAITAAGVDAVEADGLILGKDLLLTESTGDADEARPLIEEDTPSAVDRHEAAIRSLADKLTLNPDNVAALVGLTYFNNKLGRESEAVAAARRIRKANPAFSADDFEKTLQLKFRVGPLNNRALLEKAGFE